MQIHRLFEIVYILLNKKAVTAKELAERFEVSQRTIYRDIEILCQSGIPIYTSKGKGGGIGLLDRFILNKSVLSFQEQNEILSALQGLDAVQYPDAAKVLSKLNNLFGAEQVNWIEVDFSAWGGDRQKFFSDLKTAVLNNRVVEFDYYGSNSEKTTRAVEPMKLWFKDKAWYLKAYCRKRREMRTFKLTRIKNLRVMDESFCRRPEEGPEPLLTVDSPCEPTAFRLLVDSSQAYRVYDEFDPQNVQELPDGSFEAAAAYPEDDWLYGYILSFGPYARVLEPECLRCLIEDKLRRTLARYGADESP